MPGKTRDLEYKETRLVNFAKLAVSDQMNNESREVLAAWVLRDIKEDRSLAAVILDHPEILAPHNGDKPLILRIMGTDPIATDTGKSLQEEIRARYEPLLRSAEKEYEAHKGR